jgi:hypothetical protein
MPMPFSSHTVGQAVGENAILIRFDQTDGPVATQGFVPDRLIGWHPARRYGPVAQLAGAPLYMTHTLTRGVTYRLSERTIGPVRKEPNAGV